MTDKKYPLDITVACSIGLEGGLARFKNDLPGFSADDFEMVHDWNCNLKKIISGTEYKKLVGKTYRVLLTLPAKTLSKIIDKLAVPYRSYYYAKRFLDAANFVYERADKGANVVDFGRGLSPWCHIIKKNRPDINLFTIDIPETNSVYNAVSKKMNLQTPIFNNMPVKPVFHKDMFVSLGTFVYLDKTEQSVKLTEASLQFKNLFIEIEKPNVVQSDTAIVNNLGTKYNSGLSVKEINSIMGSNIPFELKEIGGYVKDPRVAHALKSATETFIVR